MLQAALEKEIKDMLASWRPLLARADHIFVQASVSNARPIYGGDDAALQRSDPRIRSIPFNTRSPPPHTTILQPVPVAVYLLTQTLFPVATHGSSEHVISSCYSSRVRSS